MPNSLAVGAGHIGYRVKHVRKIHVFKTVALNALPDNLHLLKSYRSLFLKLFVNRTSDNIIEVSYYLVEGQSILRITAIDAETETAIMAVLMNCTRHQLKKNQGRLQVLKHVVRSGTIILAATHDLELTKLLEPDYVNYHFREQVGEHGLEFDYTLKPGPSQTRNAIALLRLLGYPEAITD